LSTFLNVDNVGAERMSSGRLFYDRLSNSCGWLTASVLRCSCLDRTACCQLLDCIWFQWEKLGRGMGWYYYLNFCTPVIILLLCVTLDPWLMKYICHYFRFYSYVKYISLFSFLFICFLIIFILLLFFLLLILWLCAYFLRT